MEAVFGYQPTLCKKKVSNNDVGVFENVVRNMAQYFWLLSHLLDSIKVSTYSTLYNSKLCCFEKEQVFRSGWLKLHFHRVLYQFNLNNGPIRVAECPFTWPFGNNFPLCLIYFLYQIYVYIIYNRLIVLMALTIVVLINLL